MIQSLEKKLRNVTSLVELVRLRAQYQSEKHAYTFLNTGETEIGSLTYGELDLRARILGTRLRKITGKGNRALLLYPSGIEFIIAFFGCLYAELIPVPCYPPKKKRVDTRLTNILKDATPSVVLSTTTTLEDRENWIFQNQAAKNISFLSVTEFDPKDADQWNETKVNGNSIAFLQYTSGSTSAPKGVMVSHSNLLLNLDHLDQDWHHDSDSVLVTWLPLFHDMGLIYGVLEPLFKGFSCYFLSPSAFIQKPVRWLNALSRYGGTHSAAPNFAYDLCVRAVTEEERNCLNLRHWSIAANASETIREQTIRRFSEYFKPCGFSIKSFRPAYGLAETTLKVTKVRDVEDCIPLRLSSDALKRGRVVEARKGTDDSVVIVGCGSSVGDTEVAIVNPDTMERCDHNEIGEIWVKGQTVAQGYWNRREDTEKTFCARMTSTGEGPFLRTGDLGFIMRGQLFMTGRLKDLIIIRGLNYYPQDIEQTVEKSHTALRPSYGAAFAVEINGEEKLIVVHEVERRYIRKLNVEEVVKRIRHNILDGHDLSVHTVLLLKTGSILKTTSGKIRRQACRADYLSQSLPTVGIWEASTTDNQMQPFEEHSWSFPGINCVQQKSNKTKADFILSAPIHISSDGIAKRSRNGEISAKTQSVSNSIINSRIINWLSQKLNIDAATIKPTDSFADFGLDSIMTVQLAEELEKWLKLGLDRTIVWNFPTIESLSSHLVATQDNGRIHSQKNQTYDGNTNRTASESIHTLGQSGRGGDPEELIPDVRALPISEMAKLLEREIILSKKGI